jgi:D-alanyl-D-alanine dipeptidase
MRPTLLALGLAACAPPPPPAPQDSAPVPQASPPVPPAIPPVPPDSPPVPPDSPPASAAPPPGFVDLRAALPTACFTPGYAAPDTFTGAPLPGYAAPGAWLLATPAAALARVQSALTADHLTLVIFDAYRPRRASEAMVAWAERTGQRHLITSGYIARRSGHNHGHTIDLGLATPDCQQLDMGTPWDTLDPRSHTAAATGLAKKNRLRLLQAMRAAGFRDYPREWWHFHFPLAGTHARDVPYGPHEAPEGS